MAKQNSYCVLGIFLSVQIIETCWFSRPSTSKCCSEIQNGYCYLASNGYVPQCPSSYSPYFMLYTRTITSGQLFTKTDIPSAFSNNRRTVFIVHGWRERGSFGLLLKNELLIKEDLNVIIADWSKGSSDPLYFQSAVNTETIGALIGAYANALRAVDGSSPYYWCIGQSLGAHACGYTSKTARPLFDRITGTDPAGPSFGSVGGLQKSHAKKVDVIHTDPIFGSLIPRGDVDFYPSGGHSQPGCDSYLDNLFRSAYDPYSLSDEERIRIMQRSFVVSCSHDKARAYMTHSVKAPTCYTAKKICFDQFNIPASCSPIPSSEQNGVMGYDAVNHRYSGMLYFTSSNNTFPHCATD